MDNLHFSWNIPCANCFSNLHIFPYDTLLIALQIVVSDTVAASGRIHVGSDHMSENASLLSFLDKSDAKGTKSDTTTTTLEKKDVYRELRLRGYEYKGLFQGITSANLEGELMHSHAQP